MTTVASGRCTSAPARVDSAIGRKPIAATSAVVITGRRTAAAPLSAQGLPKPSGLVGAVAARLP